MTQVAVIGAGLIGRAWSIVFARAGFDVALWDPYPAAGRSRADLHRRAAAGAAGSRAAQGSRRHRGRPRRAPRRRWPKRCATRSTCRRTDPEQVDAEAGAVRRTGPRRAARRGAGEFEQRHPRQRLHRDLAGRARCLVAHPVNPPYLVPLVELCPAPWTDPAVVARTRALMTRRGPGAGDGEQGDGRVRAEPAAGRAAGGGVPADRGWGDLAGGSRCAGEARAWTALELHGAAGDDRPERAGRALRTTATAMGRCMPSCSSR